MRGRVRTEFCAYYEYCQNFPVRWLHAEFAATSSESLMLQSVVVKWLAGTISLLSSMIFVACLVASKTEYDVENLLCPCYLFGAKMCDRNRTKVWNSRLWSGSDRTFSLWTDSMDVSNILRQIQSLARHAPNIILDNNEIVPANQLSTAHCSIELSLLPAANSVSNQRTGKFWQYS